MSRALRQQMIPDEERAWEFSRPNRLGLRVRRQQVIAGFVVDFYVPAIRLAIELDGGVHNERAQSIRDAERHAALQGHGFLVVRLRNNQASREAVLRCIEERKSALDL